MLSQDTQLKMTLNLNLANVLDPSFLPHDYIMDYQEDSRYSLNTYPKLRQLLEAKSKLINSKNHPPIVHEINSVKSLDFLAFSDIKFDVMLLKIPYSWSLDDL